MKASCCEGRLPGIDQSMLWHWPMPWFNEKSIVRSWSHNAFFKLDEQGWSKCLLKNQGQLNVSTSYGFWLRLEQGWIQHFAHEEKKLVSLEWSVFGLVLNVFRYWHLCNFKKHQFWAGISVLISLFCHLDPHRCQEDSHLSFCLPCLFTLYLRIQCIHKPAPEQDSCQATVGSATAESHKLVEATALQGAAAALVAANAVQHTCRHCIVQVQNHCRRCCGFQAATLRSAKAAC